ncbi:MAG: DUF4258 domain-containing protein [Rhodocyclaceae bacterium]|nr:DUF4258 domain-containing protein [Rhodocyclaceae bacterium]
MADFFSKRFGKNVWLTRHARSAMARRGVDETTLWAVIEGGQIRRKNEADLWIFMHLPGRSDNLVCAAVQESSALVVKTVMINWELEETT